MLTMQHDGMLRQKWAITTISEVLRSTFSVLGILDIFGDGDMIYKYTAYGKDKKMVRVQSRAIP